MRILVGCEESQTVTKAFRAIGEAKGVPFQHDDYRIMRQTHEQLAKGEAI